MQTDTKRIWRGIALGKSHAILQSEENTAWSVGYGNSGQLGIPLFAIYNAQYKSSYKSDQQLPKDFNPVVRIPLNLSLYSNKKVLKVSCGKYHSLILTEVNQLFSTGLYTRGRLGLGKDIQANITTYCPIPSIKNIVDMSCGNDYSISLDDKGNVFAWGSNKYGCLGSNNPLYDEWEPVIVSSITEAIYIVAGPNHCAAIDRQGKVYMWGAANHGQLGLKTISNEKFIPIPKVNLLTGKKVATLALGKKHTLALTQNLEVYACGSNENGQLGISFTEPSMINRNHISQPILIQVLLNKGICKIACGKNHSCGLSLSGLLYTWGDNRQGQLGHPLEINSQEIPMMAKNLMGKAITSVYAWQDYTVMFESSIPKIEKDKETFKQWKNSVILEEQKELKKFAKKKVLKEIKKSDNQTTKKSFFRNPRKKLQREEPILVTKAEKVYKFNRLQGGESTVTIFKENADNELRTNTIAGTLYEKFWVQKEWFGRIKNNAALFFGDKEE